MARVQYGLSAFERARGDLPQLPVINMFAEQAPTEETGVILQSRPGLSDRSADMGAGPVEALFARDGVLSGDLLGISAAALYRGTNVFGAIAGTGPGSIAGNEVGVFATRGMDAVYYDGVTVIPVAFPDGAPVAKVLSGASRIIALRANTGAFYWTDPLGTTFGALDFATAESAPDGLLDALFIDDGLILFGRGTVEFWPNTGDSNLPFQPLEGRVFEKGIKATGCATAFGATFAWVTNDNQVCVGAPDGVISNPGLQTKIEASVSVRLFSFMLEGQEFIALRLDAKTYVYGDTNRLWTQFASYGEDNWAAQCWAGGVFGSALNGKTMAWGSGHLDLGGELERRFRGGFPINSGGVSMDSLTLRTNPGNTPYLTGDHAEPVVEMRVSRDTGKTWGPWKPRSLGEQGEYRLRVQWRALGLASQPGALFEFRVSGPVPFRVSDLLLNDGYGGR